MSPELRVFLDTNVVFSGLYSFKGPPSKIIDRVAEGEFRLIISRLVTEELTRILKKRLPVALPQFSRLLLSTNLEIVADPAVSEITHFLPKLSIADALILGAAINAEADYFVTGDNHFIKNTTLRKNVALVILTPVAFLDVLRSRITR